MGNLLINFRKNSSFLVALKLDPKGALNLKKELHWTDPFKERYELAL